jgi:hypothetical protein
MYEAEERLVRFVGATIFNIFTFYPPYLHNASS